MADWYVNLDGERGPFSGAKLKALADAGKISRDTPVRKNSDGDWVVAEKVKGLFAEESPPPPMPKPEGQPEPPTPELSTKQNARHTASSKMLIAGLCGGILVVGVLAVGLTNLLSGPQKDSVEGSAQNTPKKVDPVATFKQFAETLQVKLPDDFRNDWTLSYDVKKTDSVISPLTGEVTLRANMSPSKGQILIGLAYVFAYAWQDDEWVLKSALIHQEFANRDGTSETVTDPLESNKRNYDLFMPLIVDIN